MDFTRKSIERSTVTLVALAVVLVGGISAYFSLPRNEDPGFIIRTAVVQTIFPGASPERVELLVTDKLEEAIQEIPELDFLSSRSKTGLSVIYVNVLESETEMRPIWDSLRRKVERTAPQLPDNVIGPTVNDEFGDVFGTVISVTGEGFSYAEIEDVAEEVRDEFLLLPDVAKVEIYGAQEERIFVEYSNARLAELGLSPFQLRAALESLNIIIPGGEITAGSERIALEPSGNFQSLEQIRRSVIRLPGGLVFLEDIAEVTRGTVDPPRAVARASGDPALILAISMRDGGNIVDLGDQVQSVLDRLDAEYPIGIEFEVQLFQPGQVKKIVNGFVSNLLQAIGIVVLVMLVSLGPRTGVVVASLIPSAVITSLLIMSSLGIGLDQMSLAALIIALGLLVDNAIVMSESIMVSMAAGKSAVESAVQSARELRVPLLTSSLTTAAAFLPIALAESSVGEYTAPIFYVVTIALLSSWALSLTVIPLLCVKGLKVEPAEEGKEFTSRVYSSYRGALVAGLRRPWVFLVCTVAIFVGVMSLMRFVPNIFFPGKDVAYFTAELEFPEGTDFRTTQGTVEELEEYLEATHGVEPESEGPGLVRWVASVGEGGPRFMLPYNPEPPNSSYAILVIQAVRREDYVTLAPALEAFCRERFPALTLTLREVMNGPPVTDPIEIRIRGREQERIFELVDQVKAQLVATPGVKNVTDNWGAWTKKLRVEIDQPRARRAGVSSQDIALSLQTTLSGLELSEFRERETIIPIQLRSVEADRRDLGKIESLNVYSQITGRSVPLKQVADVVVDWEPSVIHRRDRLQTVTIASQVDASTTPMEVFGAMQTWLDAESATWPLGTTYEFGGEWEASVDSQASVMAKLPIAGLVIVLLLVGQFNSIRKPLIILLSIPLGLIGVVLGLLIADSYFGFMTFLGVISLSGIVINNAIVLIDRIDLEQAENGRPAPQAIVEACQRRLRPILLTTATTVGGLIPLWIGGGPMFETMAIAILFGLIFATGLTLGVVPVLYAVFHRVSFRGYPG
ncbi:MAG: efflux RND transporter permease subunit [Gemmatimonadetes bacterium]|nr:efflux RND transporter permease subunit [Gemmatimonadota bacterium]